MKEEVKTKKVPGRKKSDRPLTIVTVRVFEDQLPISNEEIREAIDLKNNGFIPNPNDLTYMNNDGEDISFPDKPERS